MDDFDDYDPAVDDLVDALADRPDGIDAEFEDDEEPRCLGCGCSESHACPGGCVWATPTLCSRCV